MKITGLKTFMQRVGEPAAAAGADGYRRGHRRLG